jgi:hypothetical protein
MVPSPVSSPIQSTVYYHLYRLKVLTRFKSRDFPTTTPFPHFDGDEEAARPAEHRPVLLACLPDGGRIHDGHELLDVLDERREEEALVAVLQVHQVQVLLQRVRLAAHVVQDALHLRVEKSVKEGQKRVGRPRGLKKGITKGQKMVEDLEMWTNRGNCFGLQV